MFGAAGGLRHDLERVDWAATPVGDVASWSPALRNAADLALHTRFPVTLFWGPQFALIYNAAYAEMIGDKHPAALGTPAREVFPEAWDLIGPMMRGVLAGEGATWVEDQAVPLRRDGRLEERYFTFSYSPVRGEDGVIEGVMDIATETTREVIGRRRLELLGALRAELTVITRAADVRLRALPLLRDATDDLPGVEIRLGEEATEERLERTEEGAVATFPLAAGRSVVRGILAVRLSERFAPDETYLGFLRLIAASLGQALDRIAAREAERGMSEALQRGLLTRPPAVAGLDIAVRYRPAAEEAQIGGDWYDAFLLPDGRLTVVVGDVTGHDAGAAAAMAAVRNLLRGVAYSLGEPPALVLAGLDEAMQGLGVDVFATAVLAQIDGSDLEWCNAGHLPPMLVEPDGTARALAAPADVLLGLGDGARRDHRATLRPGAALLLYTDGLIERRGVSLSESLEWLARTLQGRSALTADEMADAVMDELGGAVEDDVALLVLRADPQ